MLHTTPAAQPVLLGINPEGPVEVTYELDRDFRWVVQPENFDALVEHVNAHGSTFFRILPL